MKKPKTKTITQLLAEEEAQLERDKRRCIANISRFQRLCRNLEARAVVDAMFLGLRVRPAPGLRLLVNVGCDASEGALTVRLQRLLKTGADLRDRSLDLRSENARLTRLLKKGKRIGERKRAVGL